MESRNWKNWNRPTASSNWRLFERFHTFLERAGNFWQVVSEGVELHVLWGQFKSEARQSYGLYSAEVDWDSLKHEPGWRRALKVSRVMFWAMLLKLSPARRVFLLLVLVFVALAFLRLVSWLWGILSLMLLLALELADRVTMKRDLEIAREIQKWLVPEAPPRVEGLDIAFATQPQNTVAGDYYDAFLRPAGNGSSLPDAAAPAAEGAGVSTDRLLLVVADVAGKSVPAALLMATFQASLRTLAAAPTSLVDLVQGLNRYASAYSLRGLRFTTAFFAELDPATRTLHYVNAGHNLPIVRRASGQIERLEAGGLPLGIRADGRYDSGSAALAPGDLLVIFTDGLVEALNEREEEFGEMRLLQALGEKQGSAEEKLSHLLASVGVFVGATRQYDDITCLMVVVKQPATRPA
jgi:phosphoserine phosphatase RsbU/P